MANRRMFSKTITNSSQFLMMPSSSQNLYFHLGMNADDDGFCEHFAVMRMTDSKPDDLKILQAKNFVNVFDDRVLIILDWKENNYLRPDRYSPSKYLDVYKREIKRLSSGIPKVDTGKVRLGKDSIGNTSDESQEDKTPKFSEEGAEVIKAFEEVDPKNKTYYANKTQRASADFLIREYGLDQILKVIGILPQVNRQKLYIAQITTPYELKENYIKLANKLKEVKVKPKVII